MERGLLIIARRRSAMAFHTTEQRFVPAAEICDVYREGKSVRVDLRGDLQQRDYFQFWTADAATAGTIVRLLPTTRTIEYEGPAALSVPFPETPSLHRRRTSARALILISLVAGLGIATLITTTKLRDQPRPDTAEHKLTAPAVSSGKTPVQSTATLPRATAAQIETATAYLERFDARIDGLRAQYRMAFQSLQNGSLSQPDFIEGIDRWLLPQWRNLYDELASNRPEDGSLDSVIRTHLLHAARGWEGALDDYARGLIDQNYTTVLTAFDRMSEANKAQRQAWSVIEHADRSPPLP